MAGLNSAISFGAGICRFEGKKRLKTLQAAKQSQAS
jgi:hypothetical protein